MNEAITTIDSLAFGGNGVCRINGKVCFVPFSCPGDELRIAITAEKRSYQLARIVEVLVPSPSRVTPPCPVFGSCGGCSWQHIDYAQQLLAKRQILADTLWRGARVDGDLVRPVLPSPSQYGYRSRVQFKLHTAADKLRIGFFRNNSHTVEDVGQGCAIALPVINQALSSLRAVLALFPEKSVIPEISINCAENGAVAVISYNGRDSAAAAAFFREQRADLLPLSGLFLDTGRKTGLQNLYGDEQLTYTLPAVKSEGQPCRLSYRPDGFSQVNQDQNRAMLEVVRRLAAFQGRESVLDLYCGNGNFSLPIARDVADVLGIEEYAGSIAAANANKLMNNIRNAEFICSDAVAGVKRLAAEGRRFDSIIIDPPRAGAAGLVQELYRLNPDRIIYVSCDPSTLARDCGLLADSGYLVRECVPLDMFPQTYHLESVTLLRKK
ncbi:MAG: class I SAM-dependent RNA methyltransferase [Desulfuromonadales bacterium]|nr:class I SAM-dependent RNA methyltransferase [Desulfuromonadales bacterium]